MYFDLFINGKSLNYGLLFIVRIYIIPFICHILLVAFYGIQQVIVAIISAPYPITVTCQYKSPWTSIANLTHLPTGQISPPQLSFSLFLYNIFRVE